MRKCWKEFNEALMIVEYFTRRYAAVRWCQSVHAYEKDALKQLLHNLSTTFCMAAFKRSASQLPWPSSGRSYLLCCRPVLTDRLPTALMRFFLENTAEASLVNPSLTFNAVDNNHRCRRTGYRHTASKSDLKDKSRPSYRSPNK